MLQPRLRQLAVKYTEGACGRRVTPYGLRGTFTTLAVTAGLPGLAANGALSVADTARMIGHADGGATMRRHYIAPGAEESAASARVTDLLGARSGSDDPPAVDLN